LNCIVDPRNERHLANDPIVITSHLPVEALEIEYPLTVLCHELVDDSDGGGRFRRVYRAEADCYLRIDGPRLMTLLWALDGGEPGGCCTFLFGGGVEAARCAPARRSRSSPRALTVTISLQLALPPPFPALSLT